jgi:diguanylate cyclase (GGDEF)-like protein
MKLTATREVDSAALCFREVLDHLIEGDFAFYESNKCGRSLTFHLVGSIDPFKKEAEDVLRLFDRQASMNVNAGIANERFRPYPVVTPNGLQGVLLLDRRARIQDATFFNAFTAIFANHTDLITNSASDALTGLWNRGAFDQKLARLLERKNQRMRDSDQELLSGNVDCLAVLDIDHFKQINDKFGHLYGDEVLLLFSRQMQNAFREDDMLFRYGGEEFVVILRNLPAERCEEVLNRFREHIAAFKFPNLDQVTASIGYTFIRPGLFSGQIIAEADTALYYAKNHGRNQVHSYQQLKADGEVEVTLNEKGTSVDLF